MSRLKRWEVIGLVIVAQLGLVVAMIIRGGSVWLALKAGLAIVLGSMMGLAVGMALERFGVINSRERGR